MFQLLKRVWRWLRTPRPTPPPKKQIPRQFNILIINGIGICQNCGEHLPEFVVSPGLMEIFLQGYAAAAFGYELGANPYWQAKHCFAIATWNAGWDHATECGNKKGEGHGCQKSRAGQDKGPQGHM